MNTKTKNLAVAIALLLGAVGSLPVRAAFDINVEDFDANNDLDLRGPTGDDPWDLPLPVTGVANGAIYNVRANVNIVGTGYWDPFLRLQEEASTHSGMERGYNVDATNEYSDFQFEEKYPSKPVGEGYTHSFTLEDMLFKNKNYVYIEDSNGDTGEWYFEFMLDINEAASEKKSPITLTDLQLFLTDVGSRDEEEKNNGDVNVTGLNYNDDETSVDYRTMQEIGNHNNVVQTYTAVYDLDAGRTAEGGATDPNDHSVLLDYNNIDSGSGKGVDLFVYVPTRNFIGDVAPTAVLGTESWIAKNVVLFSKFAYDVDAGFEEWAMAMNGSITPSDSPGTPGVSEPGVVGLFGGGLLGFLASRRRRRTGA